MIPKLDLKLYKGISPDPKNIISPTDHTCVELDEHALIKNIINEVGEIGIHGLLFLVGRGYEVVVVVYSQIN